MPMPNPAAMIAPVLVPPTISNNCWQGLPGHLLQLGEHGDRDHAAHPAAIDRENGFLAFRVKIEHGFAPR